MSAPLGAARAVRLIAGREITTRVRSTSFLISNAVLLVVIVGGVVAASVFGGGAQDPKRVGLVGAAQSLSSSLTAGGDAVELPISIRELPAVQAARDQVAAGDLEVALVAGTGGGFVAITDEDVPSDLRRVLDIAVQQQALAAALREQGVDPAQLSAATAGAVVTVDALDPAGPDQGQRLALAYIAVFLLYVQLLFTGLAVATGVVEEETSRVVELLLSTVDSAVLGNSHAAAHRRRDDRPGAGSGNRRADARRHRRPGCCVRGHLPALGPAVRLEAELETGTRSRLRAPNSRSLACNRNSMSAA